MKGLIQYGEIGTYNYRISTNREQLIRNVEDFDKPIETMISLFQIKGKKILCHAADLIKMDWNRILGLVNPERKRIMKDYPQFVDQVGKMSGDKDFEFYTDVVETDQAHQWRKNEVKYRDNLKKYFGIEMVREEPNDILEYYDDINEVETKKIADNWIKKAKIVEPSEKTILSVLIISLNCYTEPLCWNYYWWWIPLSTLVIGPLGLVFIAIILPILPYIIFIIFYIIIQLGS